MWWLLLLPVIYVWRKMMIDHLTVSCRDLRAIHGMRGALRMLCADQDRVVFDPSKDRQAMIPGQSRRKRTRRKGTGREHILKAIKDRLHA